MKAIEEPRNARSRRTAAALLAAARRIIETDGVEALTMAAVAERAGVTRRAVYLHFGSRGDLLTALFGHVSDAEGLTGSLAKVWAAPDAVSALDQWAAHLARFHPRILAVARAIDRVRRTDPDAAAHWELVSNDWHACCRRLAAWLDADGRLQPGWTVTNAADMLYALMSFDILETLTSDRGWSQKRYATQVSVLLHATFARPGQP